MLCGDILDMCRKLNKTMESLFSGRTFFFARGITAPCNYSWLNYTFHRLMSNLRIESRYGAPPRLYDLRHTFATHRLYRWMKDKKDLHAMMPYLSAYMGHAKISETYYYIHLVPGMHEEMSDFRYESPGDIFPKAVDLDE